MAGGGHVRARVRACLLVGGPPPGAAPPSRGHGLLGKLLGPLGFVWAVANDDIPQAFGWTILTNDLIWWPAFGLYLREVAWRCGGWRALLRGD